MAWTRALLRDHVYRLLGRAPGEAANDDQVPVSLVNLALDEAFRQVALDTHAFRRAHAVTVAAGQSVVTLPADLFYVPDDGVRPGAAERPLAFRTAAEMAEATRGETGEPRAWYFAGGRGLGLHPAPAAETLVILTGDIIPHAIGGGLAAVTQAAGVATFTTARAHELAAGDAVTARGVDPAAFDGALVVLDVPSPTVFTAATTAEDEEGTGGILYYTGGLPPLAEDADTPRGLPAHVQLAPAYAAAAWIAGEFLLDDRATAERAARALARYQALIERFNGEQLAMMA